MSQKQGGRGGFTRDRGTQRKFTNPLGPEGNEPSVEASRGRSRREGNIGRKRKEGKLRMENT